jgi:pimeloyl-ACP methyl ester carboxylesterase
MGSAATDECGHLLQLEKPAEFDRIVVDFLIPMHGGN